METETSVAPVIAHRPAIVRTRYAETDQMGFIYHSHYFAYFEVGRCELVRDAGFPYAELEAHGILMPLRECGAQFRRAARYDDLLAVATRIEVLTPIRLRFGYAIHRVTATATTLLVTGFSDHLFIATDGKPVRLNRRPALWPKFARLMPLTEFPVIAADAILRRAQG